MRVLPLLLLLTSSLALAHADPSDELDRLTRELEVSPTAQRYLVRAERLRFAGRHDDALADLRAAERLGAGRLELTLARGLTLAAAGRPAAALGALDEHLALGGASVFALTAHAELLESRGRADEAILDLRRAWRGSPTPELCLELARVEEAQGRVADAEHTLVAGLGALGGAVTVRAALISLERRLGRRAEALRQARAAMAGLPVKAEWRLLAAELLIEAKRPKEARQELELARDELDAALARRPNGLHADARRRVVAMLAQLPRRGTP